MSAFKSVTALSSALVHPGSRLSEADHRRHEGFIREKLLLLSVVLAAMPPSLAFGGVPSPATATLFAFALLPLALCLIAARSGRLATAQLIAVAGEIGVALLISGACGAAGAFAWLILAAVELTLVDGGRRSHRAALVLVPAAAAVLALDHLASHPPIAERAAVAALCAFAVVALVTRRLGETSVREPSTRVACDLGLLASLGDAAALFDAGGALIEAGPGCAALLGTAPDRLGGRTFFDRLNVADRPFFLKMVGDAAHGAQPPEGRLRLRSAGPNEARYVTVEMRARGLNGRAATVMRDVSESLRREAVMQEAQRSVDAALRAKDHFLANMSHELRTPLNAIIGFSELLSSRTISPHDPAKWREYAGIVHQSGQHLLTVVNAILDTSKIQSGTFALIPEAFPPLPLLENCCEAVRPQADAGHVQLACDMPEHLEEIVADRRACRQILINLLSNAVKFTPAGGRVVLRVRPEGTALRITVADTGIGIGEGDLARLGDAFFQARSSLSRPYEGTGLGLAVVRGLVGLHGGTIAVGSEPGAGTSVSVTLPLDCRTAEATTSATIQRVRHRDATICPAAPLAGHGREPRMKKSA